MGSARVSGVLVSLLVAAALTGCGAPGPTPSASESETPSPSPTPTETVPAAPPDPADLRLSADGLGTLLLGEEPDADPATAMLVYDPTICTDERTGYDLGISEGDPGAGLWLPIPLYRNPGSDYGAWGVSVNDAGILDRIDLYDATVPTDQGIRIGDPVADVLAAYPGAVVVEEYLTDIYVVSGLRGTLQIEVASQPDDMEYWEPGQPDTVQYIHAAGAGIPVFTVAASENIAGICHY